MANKTVKIGDKVYWRGAFGTQGERVVTVEGLELTEAPRSKYGQAVEEVDWSAVLENRVVFSLSTGNWAYSEQIMGKFDAAQPRERMEA